MGKNKNFWKNIHPWGLYTNTRFFSFQTGWMFGDCISWLFKLKSYHDDKVLAWTLIHLIFILFYNPLEFYILFTFKTHLRLVFPSDILHHLHIYTTPDVENVKCKILYFTLKHNQHFANSCWTINIFGSTLCSERFECCECQWKKF